MTDCGSVPPPLVSLENSRFSAVLGRWLGHGPWGLHRSAGFIGSGAPRRTQHQNILGRVNIPVVLRSTVRAFPLANFERHGLLNSPALRARLAGGRPAVHDKHFPAIHCCFVLHLPLELIQPAIRNSFAQAAVSQHPCDIQILQTNHWVLVDYLECS
ncbi:hypothetical protein Nhal_2688 [Nitrosococcus halophilus Nc 4]|uniref:Uncharacterized protein n=1 Tax=Nitrosococcus halophilus (strain Nc4) TaxID=472759 RepID=D5BX81_NITHN|nr:hypothetical protein Nhal_2688 [Nitrosococcus halophilus Nc 4]